VTLLSSTYFYGILCNGTSLKSAAKTAAALGIGRPLRAVLAVLSYYGPLLAAILAFPISILYLLMIGFSVPCLLGNFFLRTVLRQYCGD
jgi:hypothetical protein